MERRSARAELIQAIRAGDWKKAKASALKSANAGILSDADIEEAIDEALPGLDEVQNMAPHDMLPVVSAAGPEKRAQMLPILKQKLGDFSGASPDAVGRLRAHLGRIAA